MSDVSDPDHGPDGAGHSAEREADNAETAAWLERAFGNGVSARILKPREQQDGEPLEPGVATYDVGDVTHDVDDVMNQPASRVVLYRSGHLFVDPTSDAAELLTAKGWEHDEGSDSVSDFQVWRCSDGADAIDALGEINDQLKLSVGVDLKIGSTTVGLFDEPTDEMKRPLTAPIFVFFPQIHSGYFLHSGYFTDPSNPPDGLLPPQRPTDKSKVPATLPEEAGLKIGVIDTGYEKGHPWFQASVFGKDETPGDWRAGHGTVVTGVVRQGAPKSEILVLSGYDAIHGGVDELTVAWALHELEQQGCRVVNMSFGGVAFTNAVLRWKIQQFVKGGKQGQNRVVAAAGNLDDDHDHEHPKAIREPIFPAAWPEVIGVAAGDKAGHYYSWSNGQREWTDETVPVRSADPLQPFVDDHRQIFSAGMRKTDGGQHRYTLSLGTSAVAPVVTASLASKLPYATDMRRV